MSAGNEKAPVAATTKGHPKTLEAYGNAPIAYDSNACNRVVTFRAPSGAKWTYRGKRARVLILLVQGESITQWDTLPWHTRLGGTIHAMRCDGLEVETEIEGEFRHARYRLLTKGSLIIHRANTESGQQQAA